MPTAIVPLIDGVEEIEAISIIDILRRADIDVTTAGVEHSTVTGSHKIPITTDRLLAELHHREFDLVVLPGGPGTTNLGSSALVRAIVERHHRAGKWIAAICAAPSILAAYGLVEGKTATCHFSVDSKMKGAKLVDDPVAVDGKIITSRGAGTAVLFALALVEHLIDKAKADQIAKQICLPAALQ